MRTYYSDSVKYLENMIKDEVSCRNLSEQCITAIGSVIARLRAAEADAERYRWIYLQGDSTQWMNILKVDPDDFESLDECITTLMDQSK